jgi:ATP-dependent DNA ligase
LAAFFLPAAFFAVAMMPLLLHCAITAPLDELGSRDACESEGPFIDPMLLLRTDSLPNDGERWAYQLKFDGYRAVAFKTRGKLFLGSRNDNDLSMAAGVPA